MATLMQIGRRSAAGLVAAGLVSLLAYPASAATLSVKDGPELLSAMAQAQAGDVIQVVSSVVQLGGHKKFKTKNPGRPDQPITIRGNGPANTTLIVRRTAGLDINQPHWVVENLSFVSTCQGEQHRYCEHALHVYGNADHLIVRNTRMVDFNAAIKANGSGSGNERQFPDSVVIERSYFYNTTPRETGNPVTAVDVVGGQNWVLRDNVIADYARTKRDQVSYHAFLKGNSRGGTFERNLVLCEWRHSGQIRIGLSFGGGGTSEGLCDQGSCDQEHVNGTMRNNIVANCPADIGIYLNKSANTQIYNNLLYRNGGIDVRFESSQATLRNNVVSGSIRARNGGTFEESNNIIAGSWAGMVIGPATRYAKRRLEGQDLKYPSYVSKDDVKWAQDLVDLAAKNIVHTWLAYGTNTLRDIFRAPDSLDFEPTDPDAIAGKGAPIDELETDFCGQRRQASPPDIGPFELDSEACRPYGRLQQILEIERISQINSMVDAANATK